jgi:hypothetical protein
MPPIVRVICSSSRIPVCLQLQFTQIAETGVPSASGTNTIGRCIASVRPDVIYVCSQVDSRTLERLEDAHKQLHGTSTSIEEHALNISSPHSVYYWPAPSEAGNSSAHHAQAGHLKADIDVPETPSWIKMVSCCHFKQTQVSVPLQQRSQTNEYTCAALILALANLTCTVGQPSKPKGLPWHVH